MSILAGSIIRSIKFIRYSYTVVKFNGEFVSLIIQV